MLFHLNLLILVVSIKFNYLNWNHLSLTEFVIWKTRIVITLQYSSVNSILSLFSHLLLEADKIPLLVTSKLYTYLVNLGVLQIFSCAVWYLGSPCNFANLIHSLGIDCNIVSYSKKLTIVPLNSYFAQKASYEYQVPIQLS